MMAAATALAIHADRHCEINFFLASTVREQ